MNFFQRFYHIGIIIFITVFIELTWLQDISIVEKQKDLVDERLSLSNQSLSYYDKTEQENISELEFELEEKLLNLTLNYLKEHPLSTKNANIIPSLSPSNNGYAVNRKRKHGINAKTTENMLGGWSPCSFPCGIGVSYRLRNCDTNEIESNACQRYMVDYKLCNTKPCKEMKSDFRYLQCQSFDKIPYRNQFFNWIPFPNLQNPCSLTCQAKGHEFVVVFSSKVLDGSRCTNDTLDVCINGKCRLVGCDMKLGSSKKVDSCGVCGGDNSKCNHAQYYWEETDFSACSASCAGGYQMTSSFCKMLEPAKIVPNFFCEPRSRPAPKIRTCSEHHCPPKWYSDDWSKCPDKCGIFKQSRRVYCGQELKNNSLIDINAKYCASPAPGTTRQCPVKKCSYWKSGRWSQCSVTCGYGVRTLELRCIGTNGRFSTDCKDEERPKHVERCFVGACPDPNQDITTSARVSTTHSYNSLAKDEPNSELNSAIYKLDSLDIKSKIDRHNELIENNGILKNIVENGIDDPHKQSLNADNAKQSHGSHASNLLYLFRPDFRYVVSDWSECSKPCGMLGSRRTRTVKCKVYYPYTQIMVEVPEDQCRGVFKPPSQENCDLRKCSEGAEARDPSNKLLLNAPMESAQATKIAEPEPPKDVFLWKYRGFATCSAKCLGGIQDSIILCVREKDGQVSSDDNCDSTRRPPPFQRTCNEHACPPRWEISTFSECSHTCGGGISIRSVRCLHQTANGKDNIYVVPPEMCPEPRPESKMTCNAIDCPPFWAVGNWSQCTKTCTEGFRKRPVYCQQVTAKGHITYMADEGECLITSKKPDSIRECKAELIPEEEAYCDYMKNSPLFKNSYSKNMVPKTLDFNPLTLIPLIASNGKSYDKIFKKYLEKVTPTATPLRGTIVGALRKEKVDSNVTTSGDSDKQDDNDLDEEDEENEEDDIEGGNNGAINDEQSPNERKFERDSAFQYVSLLVPGDKISQTAASQINAVKSPKKFVGAVNKTKPKFDKMTVRLKSPRGELLVPRGIFLKLKCKSRLDRSLEPVIWYKDRKNMTAKWQMRLKNIKLGSKVPRVSISKFGVLKIRSVKLRDRGRYVCKIADIKKTVVVKVIKANKTNKSRDGIRNKPQNDEAISEDEELDESDYRDDRYLSEFWNEYKDEPSLLTDRKSSEMINQLERDISTTYKFTTSSDSHVTTYPKFIEYPELLTFAKGGKANLTEATEYRSMYEEESYYDNLAYSTANSRSTPTIFVPKIPLTNLLNNNIIVSTSSTASKNSAILTLSKIILPAKNNSTAADRSGDDVKGLDVNSNAYDELSPSHLYWQSYGWTKCSQSCGSRGIQIQVSLCHRKLVIEKEPSIMVHGDDGLTSDVQMFAKRRKELNRKMSEDGSSHVIRKNEYGEHDNRIDPLDIDNDNNIISRVNRDNRFEEDSLYKIISDEYCQKAGLVKPPKFRRCGSEECPIWRYGLWQECKESPCENFNIAVQERKVFCAYSNGSYAPRSAYDSSGCRMIERPVMRKECFNERCKAEWIASTWSQCSKTCGYVGIKTRVLHCVWYNSTKSAGSHCIDKPRPETVMSCENIVPCPEVKSPDECRDLSNYCRAVKEMHLCHRPEYKDRRCCLTCSTSSTQYPYFL
ncbi:unnamed protein product [Gordionus sp. m RMFG-2023]|uniref:uncharacterized protein LOC135929611 n=1 Tax=Gordionus sp. m RMFG-2023 TaxID=3053472 RepID=UPI0030E165B2